MKKYNLTAIFCLIVISCSLPPDPGSIPSTVDKSIIMPLKVGNNWKYKVTIIDTVKKETTIDTLTVAIQNEVIIKSEKWFVENIGGAYINRSNGLWYVANLNDTTFMAKYPATVKDTFSAHSFYQSLFTVISVDSSIHTFAGTFSCYVYKNSDSNGMSVDCYSPGIGLISRDAFLVSSYSTSFYLKWELISYNIY